MEIWPFCKKCGEWKHLSEFHRDASKVQGIASRCKSCTLEHTRIRDKNLQLRAFGNYGGLVCACCGEKRIEFLCIDHINGGGEKHRREIGKGGGGPFYNWLRKNNYPAGYRVLCSNCNSAIGRSGYCPHEWERLYPMIYAEQDIDLTQWKEAVEL